MGIADRDYHRSRPGGGFMSRLTPVVKWLLIINIGIFILDYLMLPMVFGLKVDDSHPPPVLSWGAFRIQSAIFEFRIWEFITFQFLHGHLLHIMLNSIGLFFFGPLIERWWGSRRFLIFYLLCGCAGAAFFTLLTFLGILPAETDQVLRPLVGASAGIYGIFIGVAISYPDIRVMLLFPPIELSMRQLAIALMAFAVGVIVFNLPNSGGEAGHLGGAILGYFLMRHPRLLGRDSDIDIIRPRRRSPFVSKIKPRTSVDLQRESDVDLILDKISREGFQSLTDDEREVLRKAAGKNPSDS